MKNHNQATKNISSMPMDEWSALGIKGYLMLMIEFLRISPSYELARKIRSQKLDKKTQERLITDLYQPENSKEAKYAVINDFKAVLTTFDEFGDVSNIEFEEWWSSIGIFIYGIPHSKPTVKQIARIETDEQFEPIFNIAYKKYLTETRRTEGNPTSLVLGIPLGLPKANLLRQVSKLIDRAKIPVPRKAARVRKPLAAKRLRSKPLITQLRLLMGKAKDPKMQLWRLGLWAEVSPKHAKTLDLKENKKRFSDADSKEHLAILTSRTLKKAKQVAENAARGSFPNSKPVTLPNHDFDEIYKRLRSHYKTLKPR